MALQFNFDTVPEADPNKDMTHEQRKKMFALLAELGIKNRSERLKHIRKFHPDRRITTSNDLSYYEMIQYIDELEMIVENEKEKPELKLLSQVNQPEKQLSLLDPLANQFEARDGWTGQVISIRWKSNDNNFFIFRLETDDTEYNVTGNILNLKIGELVRVKGEIITHETYGEQIKASVIERVEPTTIEGIERFLSSSFIRGIGDKGAALIVEKFGIKSLEIIEKSPEKLLEIKGISAQKLEEITKSYNENKEAEKALIYLIELGLTTNQAQKIYSNYEEKTIKVIQENPYVLINDIAGIGFMKADKIAMATGIKANSEIRIKAGLNFVLNEKLAVKGHTAFNFYALIEETQVVLMQPTKDQIQEILLQQIEKGEIRREAKIDEYDYVSSRKLNSSEKDIASILYNRAKNKQQISFENANLFVETRYNTTLSQSQAESLEKILNSNVSILTGGPGTGKTFLTRMILECINSLGESFLLVAPTGKAAKRMQQATGERAYTIHMALSKELFRYPKVIIIDESSMLDVNLCAELLRGTNKDSVIIFVGDVDQLPSIGAGNVLQDLIQCNEFTVCRLIEIQRQAQESKIIQAAHAINNGNMPIINDSKNSDFIFWDNLKTNGEILNALCGLINLELGSKYSLYKDVQVLTPMRKTDLGVNNLNKELQNLINPNNSCMIKYGETEFRLYDKVIQMKNNHDLDVANGESGYISDIEIKEKKIIVNYGNREVIYPFNDLNNISLNYACTIHKSQGSEYPCVIIPISKSFYKMMNRKLIYTAITRGKEMVYLLGDKQALRVAINNTDYDQRISLLQEFIIDEIDLFREEGEKKTKEPISNVIDDLIDDEEDYFDDCDWEEEIPF